MKSVLGKLGIKKKVLLEGILDGKECYLCGGYRDKIIIAFMMDDIKEIEKVVYSVPDLKNVIEKDIKEEGDKKTEEEISLPTFLWDIYIVGFYNLSINKRLDVSEISKVHRDRYIARKIIIEYENETELIQKYNQIIDPQVYLNELYSRNSEEKELIDLHKIDESIKEIKGFLEITTKN
ncbi:hypothetical protein [Bacillus paranthracis]|uniref:hypothetical protein n=1 Tax=Bacillus cereus group TaxID=86661 RepID=UPI0021D04590|nr:hypothetical protein [Bacillus paranthracis]MCU4949993.1 hypothetical protein [Bacillus paranthracis]MDR4139505.1 hypothetical protein [Bacillus paranthracis]MDR4393288.1 hypothetical protein [Bacillus paranthracis]MED1073458.1 hypothetical protein [Bacillus paranthracis]HDR4699677.1 hypothetical protein [Bacillus paranthracis]